MPDTQSVKMPCEIRRIDLDGATFKGTHEHFEPTYGTGSTFQYDDGNQVRRRAMRISYNKLWKMLIDKEMTKMELKDAAGISAASIAKLGKGGNITTDVLLKICKTLDCKVEDIMETIVDK